MSRRVLYFVFQPVSNKPPCVTEILTLRDMGIDVAVLTRGCSDEIMAEFRRRNVDVELFDYKRRSNKLIQKAENAVLYWNVIHSFMKKYWTAESVLWVGSEQTIIKMWPYIRNVHPVILNALEFYEEDWYQKSMKRIAPRVDVLTACEPHRAQMMKDWWGLSKLPYVIPNKTYAHPRQKNMKGSTAELRRAIQEMEGKKTILYQGSLVGDRDLSLLASALNRMNSDYYLVLSGPVREGVNWAEKLKQIYSRTIYLGNLPAPLHLEVTSHATICTAFYKDNSINNRYCAPNKIFEYAGCGIPMLCNNVPGLTETVGRAGAAECVDFSDPDAVIDAIHKIESDYETYSEAAFRFFDDTDITSEISKTVEDAFMRIKAGKA